MTLQDYSYEELIAEVVRRRKLRTAEQREKRDRERYLAHREEKIAYQKAYYQKNRNTILAKKKKNGFKKYGSCHKNMMPTEVAEQ